MFNFSHVIRKRGSSNSGFALVVVLLLLTALSLVGVASLRSTSLQEKMAGNLYFKNLSMQDAEAALRSTAARMESKLGSAVAIPPATASADPNWRNFNPSSANQSNLRLASAWANTRTMTSLARSTVTVNAVTESFGISELAGCDVNVGRPGACKFRFTRMSSRANDPVTGASSITQQFWTFPN